MYDPQLSFEGVNIYCSENISGGYLLDMTGNILHMLADNREKKVVWKLIEPYQKEGFLVLIEEEELLMLDWNSKIKWAKKMSCHHDVAVADNGDIYTLINKKIHFPQLISSKPIIDDVLVILTKDEKLKKEISFAKMIVHNPKLLRAFKRQKKKEYSVEKGAFDIFHTNKVEIIGRDILSGEKRLFEKGDVLFCMRNLNLIGVVDIEKENIIWSWGLNDLDYPHHPSLLENGNILIFDNGTHRKYSRVIELNPITEKIEWEYKGNPPESFYSESRGASQRLPNGNTLITDSHNGRVFEITSNGKVVWEFYNPQIDDRYNQRAAIYRMMRITDKENYANLGAEMLSPR